MCMCVCVCVRACVCVYTYIYTYLSLDLEVVGYDLRGQHVGRSLSVSKTIYYTYECQKQFASLRGQRMQMAGIHGSGQHVGSIHRGPHRRYLHRTIFSARFISTYIHINTHTHTHISSIPAAVPHARRAAHFRAQATARKSRQSHPTPGLC
jgi:hypothetical protein